MRNRLAILICIISALFLLTTSIRGRKIDLEQKQTARDTSPAGPYEGSNSTSRLALTQAIVENKSLTLSFEQAKFSAPDVAKYNDRYFSLFAPGISFLGVPFYWFGSLIGLPQLFAYLSVTLTAFLNLVLIYLLSRKLGASGPASALSSLVFLVSSNALAYSTTFTQHHASAAIILISLILVMSKTSPPNSFALGFLTGLGGLIDIPNLLFQIPSFIHFAFKNISRKSVQKALWVVPGVAIPVGILFWYNFQTTGSPFRLAQFVGRAREFVSSRSTTNTPSSARKFSLPFDSRKQLNGLYILLFSDERGWIYHFPIFSIGVIGLVLAFKSETLRSIAKISTSTILLILVSYSMFGDPWGGWSFGPRYLIPALAVLAAYIGIAIQKFGRNLFFTSIFLIMAYRSTYISILGALTTNAVPPKQEAENLLTPIPYTYKYNLQFVKKNISSSLIYNLWFTDKVTVKQAVNSLTVIALLSVALIYFLAIHVKKVPHR